MFGEVIFINNLILKDPWSLTILNVINQNFMNTIPEFFVWIAPYSVSSTKSAVLHKLP